MVLTPDAGQIGDEIIAFGGPWSAEYDTSVVVDGVPAEVLAIDRGECSLCDACRESVACTRCEVCVECAESCADCVESMSFAVPEMDPGEVSVVVTNAFGASLGEPFTVLPPDEATSSTGTGLRPVGDSLITSPDWCN